MKQFPVWSRRVRTNLARVTTSNKCLAPPLNDASFYQGAKVPMKRQTKTAIDFRSRVARSFDLRTN